MTLKLEQATSREEVLEQFTKWVEENKKISLYAHQEEAILELLSGNNLILNTPTGSGKSLVATALHHLSWSAGRVSVYACPVKALVNEKFLALCQDFPPQFVGMMTGDATVNPDAPILCCTTEILAIRALRQGATAPFDDIIIDEFHYYSDSERGWAWQVPLLELRNARFLIMSATLGDVTFIKEAMTRLNQKPTVWIHNANRPVPLEYEYAETHLSETIERLQQEGKSPIYVVCVSQRQAAEQAQALTALQFKTPEIKAKRELIKQELQGFSFSSPYGKEIQKYLRLGIGLHHAGLLPKYKILTERLGQKGLLHTICGTDTLGVGVNLPIKTVLFTQLCRFDGTKTRIVNARDFHQMAGRAGRKGFDDKGYVVAQAPEFFIENEALKKKASQKGRKLKPHQLSAAPGKNFVPWTKETFLKLIDSEPEPLRSRFRLTPGMLLHVLGRTQEHGPRAVLRLIRESHDSKEKKSKAKKRASRDFRLLLERGIVMIRPHNEDGSKRINPILVSDALQDKFALNQPLALFLYDALSSLDPTGPEYALDVLTYLECILEDPSSVLNQQLYKLRSNLIRQLKQERVPFEERNEILEQLKLPAPKEEELRVMFDHFLKHHPWLSHEEIKPKSIARDMVEQFFSFSEYIQEHSLERIEGTLLRYLMETYRGLAQMVPQNAKTEEVLALEDYLGQTIRQIDSSLLLEWEKLTGSTPEAIENPIHPLEKQGWSLEHPKSRVQLRNELFRMIRAFSTSNWSDFLDPISNKEEWSEQWFMETRARYKSSGHYGPLTTPAARAAHTTHIEKKQRGEWVLKQVLIDREGLNDWSMEVQVKADGNDAFVLKLLDLSEIR